MTYRRPFTVSTISDYTEVVHVKDYCAGTGSGDNTIDLQRAIFDAFAIPVSYNNVTIDIGPGAFVHWASHGLIGNEPVVFTGNLPSPLIAGLAYRPIPSTLTANTFQISNAPGGPAITTSGSTSSTQAGVVFAYHPVNIATSQKGLLFQSGYFITTHPLAFPKSTYGAIIFGSGQFATTISNTASNSVFVTDGFEFSLVSDMNIYATGTSGVNEGVCCFDSNWNGHGTGNNQRNTFRNIRTDGGEYGIRFGWGGSQCDTSSGIDLFLGNHSIAAWSTFNFNALGNNLYGGNIAECGYGAYFAEGTGSVYGTLFEASSIYDIYCGAASAPGNGAFVSGVRTESPNFVDASHCSYPVFISGCGQDNSNDGYFIKAATGASIRSCSSVNGKIVSGQGMTIDDCLFGRVDWLITNAPANTWTSQIVSVRNIKDISNYYNDGFFTGGGGTIMGKFVPNAPYPLPYTVATLPLVGDRPPNYLVWVTDAATNVVGSFGFSGGGSHLVLCYNNGSVWIILVAAT